MVRRKALYRDSVELVETDLSAVQLALVSAQGRLEDVPRGGCDVEQHLKDMELDGVAGEVLYPSQGLFYYGGYSALPTSGSLNSSSPTMHGRLTR
jgi:hypothetical protein